MVYAVALAEGRDSAAPESNASVHAFGPSDHCVLFYEAERFLLDSLVDFLAPALLMGERSVVVATPAHRRGLEKQLEAAGFDVAGAIVSGRFVAVDAAETLSRFMAHDALDSACFEQVARELLGAQAASGRVRVFGEMVALLVEEGNAETALALESLWSRLQQTYFFKLLCAYPLLHFGGEARGQVLVDVCEEHSAVVPAESYSRLDSAHGRMREVAALQQKAASLELEIAERKRAEHKLELTLSAERASRGQAQAALRAREEFLSIASHELRTPITVLGAQAQLSLRRLERTGELDPERLSQALKTISGQADKLGRLVSQLLDVSRLDGGKLRLEPAPTDLVILTRQVVSAVSSLSDRHTLSLAGPSTLQCEVDALRLEQVLTNLLDNSIKYSPDGGEIQVTLSQPTSDSVELAVRDHGLGISTEKRQRIFERFYQAHGTSYRSGMGLGLYVSRQLIELHGGQVRADFPADGGTCITLRLPVTHAPAELSQSAP